MANFPFLGHPSQQEIQRLKEYLNVRYSSIEKHIEAVQSECDALTRVLNDLQRAEAIVASEDKYNKNASLEDVIKAPTLNESELSFFESFKYDGSETSVIVDTLLRPWQSNQRARERLSYKIRKITYLLEQKGLEKQILLDLQADLRDDGETS